MCLILKPGVTLIGDAPFVIAVVDGLCAQMHCSLMRNDPGHWKVVVTLKKVSNLQPLQTIN